MTDPGTIGEIASFRTKKESFTVVNGERIDLIVPLRKRILTEPVLTYSTEVSWKTPIVKERLRVSENIVALPNAASPNVLARVTDTTEKPGANKQFAWTLDTNGQAIGWKVTRNVVGDVPPGSLMDHFHTTTTGLPVGEEVQFSTTFEGGLVVAPVNGDFDDNGVIGSSDIDELTSVIRRGSYDVDFDLNGDGELSGSDLSTLVNGFAVTSFGDADLDGKVGFSDFIALSEKSRVSATSTALVAAIVALIQIRADTDVVWPSSGPRCSAAAGPASDVATSADSSNASQRRNGGRLLRPNDVLRYGFMFAILRVRTHCELI